MAHRDLIHAATHPIRVHDLGDRFTMLIGAAVDGRLLEVGVVPGPAGPMIVHAMGARSKFL